MQGRVIAGKYELLRQIGQGGMGTVWEARDLLLQRVVAIKITDKDSTPHLARFHREARALAQLRNEHIVQVFDFGIDEGMPYMVMELLAGEDLEGRLRREHKLSPAFVLQLVRQMAGGLMAAAALDIVHRDLKPANVFLTGSAGREIAKVLDFGVAWTADVSDLTAQGALVGTPSYMSPEQIRGRSPSRSGDLWSLSVIVFRALTGVLPFPATKLGDLIVRICVDAHQTPSSVAPELPATLDGFFVRALAKDPDERFPTVAEFIDALAQACSPATTILAIDDEPEMAHLLATRFRKQIRAGNYRFLFADNGRTAIDILGKHPDVDVILSDINMPVMDGLTFLAQVPDLTPFARTVMVSAYGDLDNIRRAMNGGAFDFVTKPIDFQDLDTTVKKAARAATELRATSSSNRENQILRRLVSTMLVKRLDTLELHDVLESEPTEATVAVVVIGRKHELPPAEHMRDLNANYEVIVPMLQKSGGMIDSIVGNELVCAWTGDNHLARAITTSRSICSELAMLAKVAGKSSPFARGLAIGVSSGQLLSACLGSNIGGRHSYELVGPTVDEALALAHEAQLGEILISASIREQAEQLPYGVLDSNVPAEQDTTLSTEISESVLRPVRA